MMAGGGFFSNPFAALTSGGGFDIGSIFSSFAGFMPFLGFEQGGIVPGPIGQPQLAVVHGGEEIMSYEDRQDMAGGGGRDMWDVKVMGDIIPRSDFATKDDVIKISKRAVATISSVTTGLSGRR